MSRNILAAAFTLSALSLALFATATADEPKPVHDHAKHETAKKDPAKAKTDAEIVFDKIKSLAGDWVAANGKEKGKTQFSISVIADGSAVVEREFPGTKMEMITVYHLDGDKVTANHFCMLGNQPRYTAKLAKKGDTINFEFAGCTNLKSKDDAHMHHGYLTIVDQDNIKSVWTMFVKGEASEDHAFELTRKKD